MTPIPENPIAEELEVFFSKYENPPAFKGKDPVEKRRFFLDFQLQCASWLTSIDILLISYLQTKDLSYLKMHTELSNRIDNLTKQVFLKMDSSRKSTENQQKSCLTNFGRLSLLANLYNLTEQHQPLEQ